jgi:hypothetical protein
MSDDATSPARPTDPVAALAAEAYVVIYFAMRKRSAELLGRLKDRMGHNNAVMSMLCLVIGMKLIGDAITGLTS